MTIEFIGADPEVFVRSTKSGEVLSAIGILGGTKAEPREVEKGALQEDNVLAEFNIHPAANSEEFYRNIRTVMYQLTDDLTKHELEPYVIASHEYTKPYLKSLGGQALRFGCDPDYNAWTGEVNEKPNPYTCLRSAGGHVHISYTNPTPARSYAIVRAFECFKGLKMLFEDPDQRRRELYGKSGACRIKPYGVEIRSPSNYWLNTERSIKAMFDAAVHAEAHADIIDDLLKRIGVHPFHVQDAINTSDKDKAEYILGKLGVA